MPSVQSAEATRELVATQDENPMLDMNELPFDSSYEAPTQPDPSLSAIAT